MLPHVHMLTSLMSANVCACAIVLWAGVCTAKQPVLLCPSSVLDPTPPMSSCPPLHLLDPPLTSQMVASPASLPAHSMTLRALLRNTSPCRATHPSSRSPGQRAAWPTRPRWCSRRPSARRGAPTSYGSSWTVTRQALQMRWASWVSWRGWRSLLARWACMTPLAQVAHE